MELNFARLNHILIPPTKTARDRFRQGLIGRLVRPVAWLYRSLSEEGRMLAVVTFIAAAFGQDVRSAEIYLLWCVLFGALAGSLAVKGAFTLDGVHVEAIVPKRATVGEPIAFAIVVRNDGARRHDALRVHGPFLPWDGRWVGDTPRVRALAPNGRARVEVRARFVARGEHHLDPFDVTALVPFGLAQGRPVETSGVKFLVVPRIARVSRLALALGRKHQPGGVALASRTGDSMDLKGIRAYRPGDPIRDLYARGWARRGEPVVREYQEEFFTRVGVVLDVEGAEERRAEAAISLAAGIISHLAQGEALIDLLVVGGEAHQLTLGRSLGFLEQALDLLACVEVERGPRARAVLDADAILGRIAVHLPRLSCVVVVMTSADDGGFAARVRAMGTGCVVVRVVRARDVDARVASKHGKDGNVSRALDTRTVTVDAIERGEGLVL